MKCPECNKVSTFTHSYTQEDAFIAPLIINEYNEIVIDYNKKELEDTYGSDEIGEIICDKCHKEVEMENIEIV